MAHDRFRAVCSGPGSTLSDRALTRTILLIRVRVSLGPSGDDKLCALRFENEGRFILCCCSFCMSDVKCECLIPNMACFLCFFCATSGVSTVCAIQLLYGDEKLEEK